MLLGLKQTEKILSKYKIPYLKSRVVKNQKAALAFAKKNNYPLVLKILAPNVLHKTDIKAVIINIEDKKELLAGYNKILNIAKKKKGKVLIQKMAKGREVIMGAKIDKVFGPVVLFGLGGIFVEVLKDVSFRLAPIKKAEAKEMLKQIKGYKLLKGYRGQTGVNLKELKKILIALSDLITKENLKEIDLNPVIVNEKKAVVVDAKIII